MLNATLMVVAPSEDEPFITFESVDKSGYVDNYFLPWPEKRVLYPIRDYIADCLLIPGIRARNKKIMEYYDAKGITHICLLPADEPTGAEWWFDDTKFPLGFLVYWCEKLEKYHLFYDHKTADVAARWIETMQAEWGQDEGFRLQEANETYH
jgi:hypothetical protein